MAEKHKFLTLAERILFPRKCTACRTPLNWHDDTEVAFCADCMKKWVSETLECCGFCGSRVTDCTCMPDALQKAGCEALYKLVYYTPHRREPVQNRLIYRLKDCGDRGAAAFAASQMSLQIRKLTEEKDVALADAVLTYLPRARLARWQTGADQAWAVARALAAESGIPVERLIRRRSTANRAQKKLSPAARLKNAKRAYVAPKKGDCRGKTVFLVDDVVTTGAGMAVATRILRKMGAARVICLCIAADVLNKDPMYA